MASKTCNECGRVNSTAARRCMWCGLPLIDEDTAESFETTRIDLDYVSGIERLDEPIPVRLVIGPSGLEVIEMMPGSRRVLIPADSLVEARAETAEGESERGRRTSFTETSLSILTVCFREEAEIRAAVFQGQDGRGQSTIDNIARIISLLIRWREFQKDRATS